MYTVFSSYHEDVNHIKKYAVMHIYKVFKITLYIGINLYVFSIDYL